MGEKRQKSQLLGFFSFETRTMHEVPAGPSLPLYGLCPESA
ncbi:hypothetical protein [Sulfuricurvum sp.]|jgi:hypothetical protein|nr:hypothetical protein [Sulfuricurvum sp.]